MERMKDIPVGEDPEAIAIEGVPGIAAKIYVANGVGTISVINGLIETKEAKDIPVGRQGCASDSSTYFRLCDIRILWDKLYVANSAFNTISVIKESSDKKEPNDITSGPAPVHMALDIVKRKIYVVNRDYNTVSVINGLTDTKETNDIFVGDQPVNIAFRPILRLEQMID
ncbi:MAG: hypothetical protein WAZ77_12610 [Candidatus Nitrosopolaris sp.]